LGHVQVLGGPADAFGLYGNQQNIKLAQFQAASEMSVPSHAGASIRKWL
jgi:hypothetical protein